MTPQVATYLMLALCLAMVLLNKERNPGYRCPACGTAKQDKHSEDCSWKQHYGEEF